MKFNYRKATLNDVNVLETLIQESATAINSAFYTKKEIQASLGSAWTVDEQLINDNSYWIVENAEGKAVGCGGWSSRNLLYGKSIHPTNIEQKLVPGVDSARIRAFFVHPEFTRRGIGKTLLEKCEHEASDMGFTSFQLVATLSGEKLYAKHGYTAIKFYEIEVKNGITNKVVFMHKAGQK